MVKNNRKKKASKQNLEELHSIEKDRKYHTLVSIAIKSIRKDAKIVKSFECQKIVRQLKTAQDDCTSLKQDGEDISRTSDSSKSATKETKQLEVNRDRRITKLEERLNKTKALNLDELVDVCLKRIGIVDGLNNQGMSSSIEGVISGNISPQIENNKSRIERSTKLPEKSTDIDSQNDEEMRQFSMLLIEKILRHKRLFSVIDSLTEKVSEFRSWEARRGEYVNNIGKKRPKENNAIDETNKSLSKKRKSNGYREIDVAGHDGSSGLFIDSLNGQSMPMNEEEREHGISDYGEFNEFENVKKNRMGQRARKAKAMAIEAKKSGKVWNNSINWREKKNTTEEKSTMDNKRKPIVKSSDVANMGKNWKDEGKSHPSWAAKEAQKLKSGIAQFKGTKITFD